MNTGLLEDKSFVPQIPHLEGLEEGWGLMKVFTRGSVCSLGASPGVGGGSGGGESRGPGEFVWGVLLDDLRAVAPGFGLAFGQGQPGRLRAHLRRIGGGKALGDLLGRWRRRVIRYLNCDRAGQSIGFLQGVSAVKASQETVRSLIGLFWCPRLRRAGAPVQFAVCRTA